MTTLSYPNDAEFVRHSKAIQCQLPNVKLATLQTAMANADDYQTLKGYRRALQQAEQVPTDVSPEVILEQLANLMRAHQYYGSLKASTITALSVDSAIGIENRRPCAPLLRQLSRALQGECLYYSVVGLEEPKHEHHGLALYSGTLYLEFEAGHLELNFEFKTSEHQEWDEVSIDCYADFFDELGADVEDDLNEWAYDFFTSHCSPGDDDIADPNRPEDEDNNKRLALLGFI